MPERAGKPGKAIPRKPLPVALSIAGLDPSGGAGLLADIRTFDALGAWGVGVCTSLTYQSTRGIDGRYDLPPRVVGSQLESLLADVRPHALKTGVMGSADTIREVARMVEENELRPLVVDPVVKGGEGSPLLGEEALEALVESLFPLAALVTPNAAELSAICGFGISDMEDAKVAALRLAGGGAGAVLVTGLEIEEDERRYAADLLCCDGAFEVFARPRLECGRVHGTGCVLSAALTALLARGRELKSAAREAGDLVRSAMRGAVRPGSGVPCADPRAGRRSR